MLLSDQQIWNIAHRNRDKLFLESYERGEEIPVSGGEIWQVYRGVIQLNTVKLNQEETIVGWVTPNHVFGNLFEQDTRYRPVALADVYVRRFGIKEIQQSPNLTRVLLSEFSYRSLQSQRLLAINALRRVEERLWELLLMLAEEMGCSIETGIRLTARFTHQNLAKVIGTTRVTITRILGEFQNRGWIEFDEARHIIIKKQ